MRWPTSPSDRRLSHLKAELERDRAHWLNEEMEVLTSRETYDPHPEDAWRRLKMRRRKPIELAVVQKVAAWREREARERNVPRGRVIKDDAIYEIAQQQPRDAAAWQAAHDPEGLGTLVGGCRPARARQRGAGHPEGRPAEIAARLSQEGSNAAAELLKVLLRIVAEKQGRGARKCSRPATSGGSTASPPMARTPTCRPCTAGGATCSATRR
jgi:ribonuclease D